MADAADLGAWPQHCGDTCGNVFGHALRSFGPRIPATARVLEIGCAEFDWLTRAHQAWPEMSFTGIDWRDTRGKGAPGTVRLHGDVMQADFAPESFDWIVSISAIEHIGLGHYQEDPKAEDGDIITIRHAWRWLAPGGWLYFDVPWNPKPGGYEVVGTSHRVYDDTAAAMRLLMRKPTWTGVYGKNGDVATNPQPLKGGESFFYKAYWLQKV